MHVTATTATPLSGGNQQDHSAAAAGGPGASRAPTPNPVAPPQAARQAAEFGNTELRFRINDEGRVKVKIVNSTTGEIVREVPPESLTDVQRNMLPPGLLIDRAA